MKISDRNYIKIFKDNTDVTVINWFLDLSLAIGKKF